MDKKSLISLFLEEESGQGMVEYALLIALVALVLFGAVRTMGEALVGFFNEAAAQLP